MKNFLIIMEMKHPSSSSQNDPIMNLLM